MMSENPKMNDSVDTTDCLEAIGAFKSMKNLLFLVTILALLVVGGVFWLNYVGCVDLSDSPYAQAKADAGTEAVPDAKPAGEAKVEDNTPAELSDAEKPADDTAESTEEGTAPVEASPEKPDAEQAPITDAEETPVTEVPKKRFEKFIPKYSQAAVAVRIANFTLIISATLYCLVLLMTLKISLAGRLGGINHISRAFFISLFALFILLPWQKLFPGVCLGAIYTPEELFGGWTINGETSMVGKGIYFLRFCGMWGLVVVLYFAAQLRACKWSKTTLRRLGMVR